MNGQDEINNMFCIHLNTAQKYGCNSKEIQHVDAPIQTTRIDAGYLQAPIQKGQVVGKVDLILDGDSLASVDLVAMRDVPALGFFGRAWSNIKLLTYQFLMEE